MSPENRPSRWARATSPVAANELCRQIAEAKAWRPERLDLPAVSAGGRTWVGFGRGTLDDFIAMAITNGAPPPIVVVVRGIEGVRMGEVIALPWRDGVVVGPLAAVTQYIDGQGNETCDEDGNES